MIDAQPDIPPAPITFELRLYCLHAENEKYGSATWMMKWAGASFYSAQFR